MDVNAREKVHLRYIPCIFIKPLRQTILMYLATEIQELKSYLQIGHSEIILMHFADTTISIVN